MRRMVLVASIAIVVLTAALGLAACTPPRRVLVIGDSLTVGSVSAGLGAGHPAVWTISAKGGRGTNAGIEDARARDLAAYDVVVIALGTNDFLDTQAVYRARVERMMAVLGARAEVIWINVDTATPKLAPAALGVNPALAAADAAHPNLRVADWDGFMRGQDPALRATDQIHYVPAGYDVRARWTEALVAG